MHSCRKTVLLRDYAGSLVILQYGDNQHPSFLWLRHSQHSGIHKRNRKFCDAGYPKSPTFWAEDWKIIPHEEAKEILRRTPKYQRMISGTEFEGTILKKGIPNVNHLFTEEEFNKCVR